jgi:hypothetical protein
MWFTGINYYKMVVEKNRDSIFTMLWLDIWGYIGIYCSLNEGRLATLTNSNIFKMPGVDVM